MLHGALLAAVHSTVQVQDQSDLQVTRNSTGSGVGGAAPTWSASTTPSISLASTWGKWTLGLKYTVAVAARSIESSATIDVLQQGTLDLTFRTRSFRLALNEVGSFGATNYATVLPSVSTTPALQALPTNLWLHAGSSRSTLTLTQAMTRRLDGSLFGGWGLSGGVDDASRSVLPPQSGPFGGGKLLYTASRVDTVEVRADWNRVAFSSAVCTDAPTVASVAVTQTSPRCRPTADLGSATFAWRRRLSAATDLSVRGGAVVSGAQSDAGKPYTYGAHPTGAVEIDHHARTRSWGSEITFRANAQITPIVSQQTGAVDQRLQGDVGVDWANEHVVIRSAVRAGQSVPFDVDGGYLTSNVEASVGWRLDRYLTITVGGRVDWQRYAAPPVSSPQSIYAGLGFVRFQAASRVFSF